MTRPLAPGSKGMTSFLKNAAGVYAAASAGQTPPSPTLPAFDRTPWPPPGATLEPCPVPRLIPLHIHALPEREWQHPRIVRPTDHSLERRVTGFERSRRGIEVGSSAGASKSAMRGAKRATTPSCTAVAVLASKAVAAASLAASSVTR